MTTGSTSSKGIVGVDHCVYFKKLHPETLRREETFGKCKYKFIYEYFFIWKF